VEFTAGQEGGAAPLVPQAGCRVYYFRFQLAPSRVLLGMERGRGHRGAPPGAVVVPGRQFDQLAARLRPLTPRIFDISTPEQFRRALAVVLAEISGM
jgi:hypothetical protein